MLVRTACVLLLTVFLLASHVAASDVADLATNMIGRPYEWGAEGPNTFDCSGLTQYVFGKFGVDLPRRAVNQADVGRLMERRLRRGDLVFFSSDTRRSLVTHVGIYEGGGVMVNASQRHGRVRRDDLNQAYWASRFMFARRVHSTGDGEDVDPGRPPREQNRTTRRNEARREAAWALGRIADALLRRYPR
jgi:hypothetical protein